MGVSLENGDEWGHGENTLLTNATTLCPIMLFVLVLVMVLFSIALVYCIYVTDIYECATTPSVDTDLSLKHVRENKPLSDRFQGFTVSFIE